MKEIGATIAGFGLVLLPIALTGLLAVIAVYVLGCDPP